MGHAYLFKECERYGDAVVVGINSDAFVEAYKGTKPTFTYRERADLIKALGYKVRINNSAGRELIMDIRPDVLAIGSDWATKDYYKQINVTQQFMDKLRIAMVYIPRVPGYSTTEIKSRV